MPRKMKTSVAALLAFFMATSLASEERKPCQSSEPKRQSDSRTRVALQAQAEWLKDVTTGERAKLRGHDWKNMRLSNRDFRKADLTGVHGCGVNLRQADLRESKLDGADLRLADLVEARLAGATLLEADLSEADLTGADLTGADLRWSILRGAKLEGTKLSGANLQNAELEGAVFEPLSLPNIRTIADAHGLAELRFKSPVALAQLRTEFKKNGLRDQEREITFVINHVESCHDLKSCGRYLLFEFTCYWGWAPFRILWFLAGAFGVFALVYHRAIRKQDPQLVYGQRRGIYRHWADDAPDFETEQDTDEPQEGSKVEQRKRREYLNKTNCSPARSALAFSLLSTFYFGWEELRFDHWLIRFNPKDYQLKASGVLRPVSAAQSLISLYLIVLLIWTLFGRPFG